MAGNPLKLFFDRFMLVNLERYKNDPAALSVLNSMALEQLNFANWREGVVGTATQMTVDLDIPNKLVADDQQYYTLDFASPLVSTPTNPAPVDEATLPQKGTGLYLYTDTSVTPNRLACAVVVRVKTDLGAEAIEVIKASCKFDLDNSEITLDAGNTTATIETKTFVDIIKVLASEVTTFLYDGTLKYDGSATY